MVKVELVSGTSTIFTQVVDKDPNEVAQYWTKAIEEAQTLTGVLSLSDEKRLVLIPMGLLKTCTIRITKQ